MTGKPPAPPQQPTSFWQVVGLLGVAAGVVAVGAYALDLHGHTCETCGKQWRHLGAFNTGDHDAHKCPSCGEIQWWKDIGRDGAFRTAGNRLGVGTGTKPSTDQR